MGLLDFLNEPDARLGINLLAAASPQMRPAGFGERLGLAMRMTEEQKRREKEDKARDEQYELAKANAKRSQEMQDIFMHQVGGLLGGQPAPAAEPVPLPQLGEAQGTGPYRLDVETPKARARLSKQLEYLAKNDPMTHQQVIAALVKQGAIPPPMQPAPQAQGPDWNKVAALSAIGQLSGVHGAGGLMELAKYNKPDWQQIDSGGQIQFVNKNGQQMPVITKTMSPDAVASNNLGWANFGLGQGRLNLEQNQFAYTKEKDGAPKWDAGTRQFITPPSANNPTGAAVSPSGVAPKELTEGQSKAQGFLSRMVESERILNDPKTQEVPGAIENIAGSIPIVGNYASNVASSANRQVYRQAQEDWVRAKLRKESGAVIGKDEMEQEIRAYFPQQGDGPEVIAQKQKSRQTAISSMATEGGPTAKYELPKSRHKAFQLDGGGSVIGQLGEDGGYYVTRNGKRYKVEE